MFVLRIVYCPFHLKTETDPVSETLCSSMFLEYRTMDKVQNPNSPEIITVRLGYHHKFCTRWVPKVLMCAHEMHRIAPALTFLEQYHKDGNEFLSHIIWVTGDETWVSFVNVETKEQSKQWMCTFTNQAEKV
jgi:hypothetical protein